MKIWRMVFLGWILSTSLWAQGPPMGGGPPGGGGPMGERMPGKAEIQKYLFPPELVMRYQRELELSEDQRSSILEELRQAQSQFTTLTWDLQREMDRMVDLLAANITDEEVLIEQLDKVLDLERRIKRLRLLLAVRVKNTLTEEQRTELEELRPEGRGPLSRDRRRRP